MTTRKPRRKPQTDDIEVSVNGSPWAPYDAVMVELQRSQPCCDKHAAMGENDGSDCG